MNVDPEEMAEYRARYMALMAQCDTTSEFIDALAAAAVVMRKKIVNLRERLENQAKEIRILKQQRRETK